MAKETLPELEIIGRLWDWYWTYGRERHGQFELRLSSWADQLSRIRTIQDAIFVAKRQGKPAMGVWGPSQTGKSTLISSDVDAGAGPRGEDSALHWPNGMPARFLNKIDSPDDTVGLNPYSLGSDASGCVTRFRLATTVADPMYPVEIRLAPPEQIQHAIAMGYLSECRTELTDGKKVKYDEDRFNRLLDSWNERIKRSGPVKREAFEKLCRLLDLLDILVLSGEDRYENLRPCQAAIRRQALEHAGLLSDEAHVDAFAAELLWDGRAELTNLFAKLQAKSRDLLARWGSKPILCTLPVTSLLLDIDAYQKLHRNSGEVSRVRKLVDRLSYSVNSTHVLVGTDLSNPLIQQDEDFGVVQGLVMELVVPLRADVLRQKAPDFFSFMEASDLLDFPGVALSHSHTDHTRIDLETLADQTRVKLYTEVLKRGKTASIVAAYARNLTIDGFSVLTRIQRFPAQPAQLLTGITTWWKCFDPEFRSANLLQRSPMPLNLILTFCAELVGPVVQSGVRDGLDPVFKRLRQLGPLSEPSVLTNTLATNYPQFHDGRLPEDQAQLQRAIREIMADQAFQKQFESTTSKESFRNAIENGGTDFVFKVLRDQAVGSRRVQLLDDRLKKLVDSLRALISEAYPTNADAGERRKTMLLNWQVDIKTALQASLRDDPAEHVSRILREVFSVDFTTLAPVPTHLGKRRDVELREYVARQFDQWVESCCSKKLIASHLSDIGVKDGTHLSQLLHYVVQAVDRGRIVSWMKDNISSLSTQDESRLHRRYLAAVMSNELFTAGNSSGDKSGGREHPSEADIRSEIDQFVEQDKGTSSDYLKSHQYRRVIRPILDLLRRLSNQNLQGERPSQPGDTELALLVKEFPLRSDTTVNA